MQFTQKQDSSYNKAAQLCSRFEKCTSEIREKLLIWGLSEEDAEPVVKKLVSEKYIDDERFARAYVKDKFRFNHWGKQKIVHMLRSKNVDPEILELALEEIQDDNYAENLLKLLTDKARSIKAKDKYDKRNKLMRFALSRGFESGIVMKIIRKLEVETPE